MDEFLGMLSLPLPALREHIEQELQQNPVLELEVTTATDDQAADVVVDQSQPGECNARLTDDWLSSLFISPRYTGMSEDLATEPQAREFLARKLRSAQRLLVALERRRVTLKRNAEAVFRRQRAFLEHGPTHLVLLRVEQVAGEVGIDALTVIRAIQDK